MKLVLISTNSPLPGWPSSRRLNPAARRWSRSGVTSIFFVQQVPHDTEIKTYTTIFLTCTRLCVYTNISISRNQLILFALLTDTDPMLTPARTVTFKNCYSLIIYFVHVIYGGHRDYSLSGVVKKTATRPTPTPNPNRRRRYPTSSSASDRSAAAALCADASTPPTSH